MVTRSWKELHRGVNLRWSKFCHVALWISHWYQICYLLASVLGKPWNKYKNNITSTLRTFEQVLEGHLSEYLKDIWASTLMNLGTNTVMDILPSTSTFEQEPRNQKDMFPEDKCWNTWILTLWSWDWWNKNPCVSWVDDPSYAVCPQYASLCDWSGLLNKTQQSWWWICPIPMVLMYADVSDGGQTDLHERCVVYVVQGWS